MGRPIDIEDTLAKAKAAEESGLLATALRLYRAVYNAARPNSAERRVRMADMLRLRKQGAEGMIPGDFESHHSVHHALRKEMEPGGTWLGVPPFLRPNRA